MRIWKLLFCGKKIKFLRLQFSVDFHLGVGGVAGLGGVGRMDRGGEKIVSADSSTFWDQTVSFGNMKAKYLEKDFYK